jgi:hypothetical protein
LPHWQVVHHKLRDGVAWLSHRSHFEHDKIAPKTYLMPEEAFEQFRIEGTF